MWQTIEKAISGVTGRPFSVQRSTPVSGGCINETAAIEGAGRHYFVKLNGPGQGTMFEAEKAALEAIRATATLRAPEPVCGGADRERSWLVLEYIDFGPAGRHTSAELGEQLAAMHRCTAPEFGWDRDNTIGATPQVNSPAEDWVAFYGQQRLRYQLELAAANGAPAGLLDAGDRLLVDLEALFTDYRPVASLLHGDLWGGNWAADKSGSPVIFDPATYYGDREADLAMTELFGGFDERFYRSYRNAWALDPGYETRKELYNLYHVLNHFNLFGGGYARQAQDKADWLLAEIA